MFVCVNVCVCVCVCVALQQRKQVSGEKNTHLEKQEELMAALMRSSHTEHSPMSVPQCVCVCVCVCWCVCVCVCLCLSPWVWDSGQLITHTSHLHVVCMWLRDGSLE